MTHDDLDGRVHGETDPRVEAEFDALMRDAERTYNAPPEPPDLDALWLSIEGALPAESAARPVLRVVRESDDARGTGASRRWKVARTWAFRAAVLLAGVAIGRVSNRIDLPDDARDAVVAVGARPAGTARVNVAELERQGTGAFLGRTAALLAELPDEMLAHRADPAFLARADALLLETRLLLDSPAAADPSLRSLFDDLEVVLAQVVRLRSDRDPTRADFLQQALDARDVLPRLRDAVADNAAD